MRWLQFILSHSIFIAFCAVALCWQTNILLGAGHDGWLYFFIFCSTVCSYNFYWLISKFSFSYKGEPLVFIQHHKSYIFLFVGALIGMLVSFLQLQIFAGWLLLAVLLTVIYSLPLWPFWFAKKLRRLGFIKTGLLAFTWAYVTVVIPASNTSVHYQWVLILLAARFFFMLMLCAIFDQRDIKMDKMHGLHSLATDVSAAMMKKIMAFSFLGFFIAGLLVRRQTDDNFQLAAFALTAIIVWWVYRLSLRKQGYFFYYFVVDGLMLLSALFCFVAAVLARYAF
jgi:4-hydroxybenzoate polyprenyltransferase